MSNIPLSGQAYGAMKSLGESFVGAPARKILESTGIGKDMSKDSLNGTAGIMTTLGGVALADHLYNTDFFM